MLLENHKTSDNDLWMNFINGNDACFEIIYRKYADVLFRYGIQFTTDGNLVKDAIHDVFVKLHSDRQHLKAEANNEYIDPGAEDQVTTALNQDEMQKTIRTVLSLLTDRQREIIYYSYIEELSIEEIAVLTGMNYQSVQNTIQRSLKRIRESLPLIIIFFFLCKKECFC